MLEALLSQTQKHQEEIVVIKDNLLKIQSANSNIKNKRTVPKCISVSIKDSYVQCIICSMQREVRRVYKLLLEDHDFGGWQVGNGYI